VQTPAVQGRNSHILQSKGTLVGHSDSNAAEDTGHLRVTYANNHFYRVASRGPLLRFGTAHIYNNYYNEQDTGVNTRMGAQALIQSTVFENSGKKMVYTESSSQDGSAVVLDVLFGGQSANTAPKGTLSAGSFTYKYELLGSANVKAAVTKEAGQKLAF
jgi:pectate lyase